MKASRSVEDELRERGCRVTPQRAVILESVAALEGHPSAQEVYAQAKDRLPGLNIATVYRTLDTLHRAGLVDIFNSGTGLARFALRDASNPHGHLVCRTCGEVSEFNMDLLEDLRDRLQDRSGYLVDTHHVVLNGTCGHCAPGREPSVGR